MYRLQKRHRLPAAAAVAALVLVIIAAVVVIAGRARKPQVEGPSPSSVERVAAAVNDARFSTAKAASETGQMAFAPTIVKLQILLDRAHFSPGVIDGKLNENTTRAIAAFERARELPVDGVPDRAFWNRLTAGDQEAATSLHVIDPLEVAGPFVGSIPSSFQGMARLESLGFRNPTEALAETYHMSPELLLALNPDADFTMPGTVIVAPQRGGDDLGVDIALVEVDSAEQQVRAYAADRRLLAVYPATVGSERSPAPVGRLTVSQVITQPTYRYETDTVAFGRGLDTGPREIAPGPNNPVGPVWIELDPGRYGLHGGPEPEDVGKALSQGGVRLTNWDIRELARGVREGTTVVFR